MPVPTRRNSSPLVEDELLPRHMLASMRRPQIRDSKSTNFTPLRPSPLTTRPFSGAFDDQELFAHVPVPLDPVHGLAAPKPEKRRTLGVMKNYPLDASDTTSVRDPRRPKTAPSTHTPESATSHDSHETQSTTGSSSGGGKGVPSGKEHRCHSDLSDESSPWSSSSYLTPERTMKPSKSTSFTDLRKQAVTLISKASRSASSLHLPVPEKAPVLEKVKTVEKVRSMEKIQVVEENNGHKRRRSITQFLHDVFRPRRRRSLVQVDLSQ